MKTVTAILLCLAAGAANAWGVTYQTFGNLTYGSDGSRFTTIGNRTFAKYPEPVNQGGLDANIILEGARNQPNFANTILQGQAIASQREQENRIAEQENRIRELEMQENIRQTSQLRQEAAYLHSVANHNKKVMDDYCAKLGGGIGAALSGCK
jgi:hypothetical protein